MEATPTMTDDRRSLEDRFDVIEGQLAAVLESFRADVEARDRENTKRDERIKWSRRAIGVVVAMAAFAVWDAHDSRDTARTATAAVAKVAIIQDQTEQDRVDRTLGSCASDNARVVQLRAAVSALLTRQGLAQVATLKALVPDPDPNPERTATQVAKLEAANAVNTTAAIREVAATIGFARIDGTVAPLRVCTPNAIEAYFAEQKAIADSTTTTTVR